MLDECRNPKSTYRLIEEDGLFRVLVYPKTPAKIRLHTYRFDVLPEWMQQAVRFLDTAGKDCVVTGVGRRVGRIYWLEAEDSIDAQPVQFDLFD